ncbi:MULTISPECIES: hypothetical protein [Candidatus Brocadia]|uniref:P-loop ATPase fused to an acetyltransferase n=1 Tax=Candidatus Brocadia sinica JPN1 TaxID=1197129 RepID=A0ABQ0JW35_9BACT|nr:MULTISPECIES: hypothetical protein [Brocadia]GAN32947.1 P-loop ATPase fused to an acetyltransferase [Candidatus Brocadia sinica JPN1]GJQ16253.1 MAG: hypothetical protein HBSIN01_02120 [Candidatus Brocadia sinica]
MAEIKWRNYIGMKHMELAKKKLKERGIYKMNINKTKFVVCINNEGYQASLELHKLYQVIPDKAVEDDGDIRIIDESGEDYIYPAFYFKKVSLTKDVKLLLLKVS